MVEVSGGAYELSFVYGYPPTLNSEEATATMVEATQALFGADNVGIAELGMGAEDFSYMAQEAPGCFLRLGTHNPSWISSTWCTAPTFVCTRTLCPRPHLSAGGGPALDGDAEA